MNYIIYQSVNLYNTRNQEITNALKKFKKCYVISNLVLLISKLLNRKLSINY